MEIRTTSTFTDWTELAGAWGRTGVVRIFEELRIAGIRDVYWRVFNGGLAMYPSRVAEVQADQCYTDYVANNRYPFVTRPIHYLRETDFRRYDPIADACEAAREFGVRLHLWYTIYEDEHGRPCQSAFNAQHPEYWHMDREGRRYSGTFDWFFDEVRRFKLTIVDELLRYPAAGLMLDLVRHNATASADRHGVHRFGYNPEIRAAFKRLHKRDPLDLPPDDPEWLAFKTDVRTSLIRDIRQRLDRNPDCRELALMLWPVDYRRWACVDVAGLCRDGAVQTLAGTSLAYSLRPGEAVAQYEILKPQTAGTNVPVFPGLMAYGGLSGTHLEDFAQAAEKAGAPGIMLYEADALKRHNLTVTVRALNLGVPNCRRGLVSHRLPGSVAEAEIDWSALPVYSGFLFHFGPRSGPTPSERTQVQMVHDAATLFVRFACEDGHMDGALVPAEENPQHQAYIDALGQRSPYYDQNSVSVLVDPGRTRLDYYRFGVTPRNDRTAAQFVDDRWRGVWSAEVTVDRTTWSALLRIPFATLGRATPRPGEVWGANLLRGIRGLNEISIWFPVAGQKACPHELGRLEFQE